MKKDALVGPDISELGLDLWYSGASQTVVKTKRDRYVPLETPNLRTFTQVVAGVSALTSLTHAPQRHHQLTPAMKIGVFDYKACVQLGEKYEAALGRCSRGRTQRKAKLWGDFEHR